MTMIKFDRMITDAQLLSISGGTDTSDAYCLSHGDWVYFYARRSTNPNSTPTGRLSYGMVLFCKDGEYYIACSGSIYIAAPEDFVSVA